ncbi:MAG: hypothetical protein WBN09_01770 [Woeseiaceae bacterium]
MFATIADQTEEILIAKGVAKGTATGAAYGGLYGGTRSGLDADRQKQQVFKRCLAGRGYRVLN